MPLCYSSPPSIASSVHQLPPVVREPIDAPETAPVSDLQRLKDAIDQLRQLDPKDAASRSIYEGTAKTIHALARNLWRSDAQAEPGQGDTLARAIHHLNGLNELAQATHQANNDLTDALDMARKLSLAWQHQACGNRSSITLPARTLALPGSPPTVPGAQPHRQLGWNPPFKLSPLVMDLKALAARPLAAKTFFDFSKYKEEDPAVTELQAWHKFKDAHYPAFLKEVKECLDSIKAKLGGELTARQQHGLDQVYREFELGNLSQKYGPNIAAMCSGVKVAMDQIAQAIDDQELPDVFLKTHLKELVNRIAEQACGPGQSTDFIQASRHLQAGLIPQLSAFREQVAEDVISRHVNHIHTNRGQNREAGNHVHWVNAYRNLFSEDFGLSTRQDMFANQSLYAGDIGTVRSLLKSALSPDKIVALLAQKWHDDLKQSIGKNERKHLSAQDFFDKKIELEAFGGLGMYDVLQQVGGEDKYRIRSLSSFTANLTQKLVDAGAIPGVEPQVLASLEHGDLCALGKAIYFRPLSDPTAIEELQEQHWGELPGMLANLLGPIGNASMETIKFIGEIISASNLSLDQKKALLWGRDHEKSPTSALVDLVRQGKTEEVKALVQILNDSGLSAADKRQLLLARDPQRNSLIHIALRDGDTEAVKVFGKMATSSDLSLAELKHLLQAPYGTDGSRRVSGFLGAFLHGDAAMVKAFGEVIASSDLTETDKVELLTPRDENGVLGMHWALKNGHAQTVKAFTDLVEKFHRMRIDIPHDLKRELSLSNDVNGVTGLHWALRNGHTEAVQAFKQLYYNTLRTVTPEGITREKIYDDPNVLALDTTGTPGLNWAARNGHTETILAFGDLAHFAHKSYRMKNYLLAKDADGFSALQRALQHGRAEAVKALGRIFKESDTSWSLMRHARESSTRRLAVNSMNTETVKALDMIVSNDERLRPEEKLKFKRAMDEDLVSGIHTAVRLGRADTVREFGAILIENGRPVSRRLTNQLVGGGKSGNVPLLSEALLKGRWAVFSEGVRLVEAQMDIVTAEKARDLLDRLRKVQRHDAMAGNMKQYNQMKLERPDIYLQFKNLKNMLKTIIG